MIDKPRQYRKARAGDEPIDALTASDRDALITELVGASWDVHRIAEHTRSTPYSIQRAIDRMSVDAAEMYLRERLEADAA